ncbi:MAG: hypothetical protein RDV48_01885 [Candidatus Eremiobacteraeota bacterium]|nr:hypothetical protein [Candidatus Eremiobacteraeota bacterium]
MTGSLSSADDSIRQIHDQHNRYFNGETAATRNTVAKPVSAEELPPQVIDRDITQFSQEAIDMRRTRRAPQLEAGAVPEIRDDPQDSVSTGLDNRQQDRYTGSGRAGAEKEGSAEDAHLAAFRRTWQPGGDPSESGVNDTGTPSGPEDSQQGPSQDNTANNSALSLLDSLLSRMKSPDSKESKPGANSAASQYLTGSKGAPDADWVKRRISSLDETGKGWSSVAMMSIFGER